MKAPLPHIIPFWLWNGVQTEPEISRQLQLVASRGIPGVAIHARTGNEIPYLSERWMALVRHACEEAKRLGLVIWIYDEFGFPSGSVEGRLPGTGEDYQQKSLHFEAHPLSARKELEAQPDVLRVFPKGRNQLLVFRRHLLPQHPDFLNPKTVKLFLRLAHEEYRKAVGDYFGNVIQAFFTDDNLILLERGAVLPYTDSLEESFTKTYGYSLLDNLDALVENRPESPAIRLDYYRHLAERFNAGFVRPMHAWASRHRLKFYGHLSSDEGPMDYCSRTFGDTGEYMMSFHTPGADDFLTFHHDKRYLRYATNQFGSIDFHNGVAGFSTTVVMKQPSSVASQLGDGSCMSETFSSLGWGVSPDSLIAHMNYLCLMGINITVPHYYAYSTALQAKRDHPASFFFQQPYFPVSREIFAETDRSLTLTARGRNAADTLVIYPIQSVQAGLDGDQMDIPGNYRCETHSAYPDCRRQTELFQRLCHALLQAHVGFELGYESVIRHHAQAEEGALVIGHARYTTVILPGLTTISSTLLKLLQKARSLRIIYLASRPDMVDGKPFNPELLPQGECHRSLRSLAQKMPSPILEGISSPETGVSARCVDGKLEYMVAHFGGRPTTLHFDLKGYELYLPASDTRRPLPADVTLQPGRAVHLLPSDGGKRHAVARTVMRKATPVSPSWEISLDNPNVLMLDAARPPYGFLTPFDDPDFAIQPKNTLFYLEFDRPKACQGAIRFAYEPQAVTRLKLNGTELLTRQSSPSKPTSSLLELDVTRILRHRNVLTFDIRNRRPEPFYLFGDFRVRLGRRIHSDGNGWDMPEQASLRPTVEPLRFGSLSEQGCPFYWGSVSYETTLELKSVKTIAVRLPKAIASAITLSVNGKRLETLSAEPWLWEIPAQVLKPGVNSLRLCLFNTAQNFFGPHHPDAQRRHFTGWRPKGNRYFCVASFGILEPPELSIF